MSKKDMIDTAISSFKLISKNLPHKYHFKLHRIYNPSPVPLNWRIEKGRKNKDFHLLYVIAGNGCYFLNGKEVPLKRGMVIFVSNNFPHSAKGNIDNLPHTYSVRFGVYKNDTDRFLQDYFNKPFAIDINPLNSTIFYRLFQRLYNIHTRNDSENHTALENALLTEIITELNSVLSKNSNAIDKRIASVIPYMQPNSKESPNVNEIASKVNLSVKQFSRLFVKAYGISPHQYIIMAKIRHAIFLLEETDMSIKEIALDLGYSDQYTFSKQFKLKTDKSPSSVRITHNQCSNI